jgi:type III pantothenate kinase
LVYEIDGFIDEYRAICSNFIIILTGGDTEFLAKRLKIPYLPIQISF